MFPPKLFALIVFGPKNCKFFPNDSIFNFLLGKELTKLVSIFFDINVPKKIKLLFLFGLQ